MTAPVELGDLATEVVRRVAPLAATKGISLEAAIGEASATVDADPDRLQQVLLILLDNAIKHTPPDGRVHVRVDRQAGQAVIEVGDTGDGIAPEDLARLFDRFYRADAARSRANGGSGLGLAIARALVHAHQGHIDVSSTPGAGTRVSVRIPLDRRSPSPAKRLRKIGARLEHAQRDSHS